MGLAATEAREARRLSTLLDVSQSLSGTLNLKAALHRVLEILAERHGAARSMVTLLQDGAIQVEAAAGSDGSLHAVRYRPGDGLTGRVVESGKPVVVPRASREPELVWRADRRQDARQEQSFVCVPILLSRRALGALGVALRFKAERDYDSNVKF